MNKLFIILVIALCSCSQRQEPLSQIEAYDSLTAQYQSDGWSKEAAEIIAGFETDLLDQSDSIEYQLYQSYLED